MRAACSGKADFHWIDAELGPTIRLRHATVPLKRKRRVGAKEIRSDQGAFARPAESRAGREQDAGYTLSGAGTSNPLRYDLVSMAVAPSSLLKRFA